MYTIIRRVYVVALHSKTDFLKVFCLGRNMVVIYFILREKERERERERERVLFV